MRQDEIKIDLDSLTAGIRDGLTAAAPQYSTEVLGTAMQRLEEQQMARFERIRVANEKFLADNAAKPGIQTTSSGLQYRVVKSGAAGGASPGPQDVVVVHYKGSLIDGTVFDSTASGPPAEFVASQVIPGWSEALKQMKVGDKWQLFIPARLGYGANGWGDSIPPHSALIFEVELLNVKQRPTAGDQIPAPTRGR